MNASKTHKNLGLSANRDKRRANLLRATQAIPYLMRPGVSAKFSDRIAGPEGLAMKIIAQGAR